MSSSDRLVKSDNLLEKKICRENRERVKRTHYLQCVSYYYYYKFIV